MTAQPPSDLAPLVARHEAIAAVPIEETTDALIDEAGQVIREIMAMPAPDAAAVVWKLDYVLADKAGPASYTPDFVEQLIADYRRFLVGA